jgi:hypothetical protein
LLSRRPERETTPEAAGSAGAEGRAGMESRGLGRTSRVVGSPGMRCSGPGSGDEGFGALPREGMVLREGWSSRRLREGGAAA